MTYLIQESSKELKSLEKINADLDLEDKPSPDPDTIPKASIKSLYSNKLSAISKNFSQMETQQIKAYNLLKHGDVKVGNSNLLTNPR